MKIFSDFENAGFIKNAVVTTGSFDGVHQGHKVILQRLKKLAFETGGETVLITFHPHPRKVLYPDTIGKDLFLLNSQREKIELLQKAGLDNLIIINFTIAFSQITSVDFVKNILLNKIHAKKIVIGRNHHFGHNREGDSEKMHQLALEYGFELEEIPEQEIQDELISSGKIRNALLEGDIEKANIYLAHPYIILGELEDANPVPKETGIRVYSVRIEEESKLIPKNGVYAVSVMDNENLYRGLCFIRKKGNLSTQALVDFYLFDRPSELSGTTATVLFHKFIREEMHFDNPEAFKAQLMIDQSKLNDQDF